MTDEIAHGHGSDRQTLHQVVSIVAAYVSHNSLRPADLPELIASIHGSLLHLDVSPRTSESKAAESPAVPVKKSVNRDFIVCLEDGKKFKSLRRHLSSFHGLNPDEYRAKWNLPSDYPMVAPAYSATRSQLAKESGLGQVARPAAAKSVEPDAVVATPKARKRGRPKKTA